jgi:hypothetical protein
MSRRKVLSAAAGIGIGAMVLRSHDQSCAAPIAADAASAPGLTHNIWVWRFDVDGPAHEVLERLRACGMGIILKTHEGADWMARFDSSPTAIRGPQQVREMAEYFESAGVPFHAWAVARGEDPEGEAQIGSEVLNCGVRSLIFDLEPPEDGHYWQGTSAEAVAFGYALRSRQPNAQLGVAPDARPWQIDAVPLVEYATFCNSILPQAYWQTFNSPTNLRMMGQRGYAAGPEGMTPELILDATADKLRGFGLPIRPIGQGTAGAVEWQRFVNHAYALQMDCVSVWRYGTASSEVWPTLQTMAPAQPVAAPSPEAQPAVAAAAVAPQAEVPTAAPSQDASPAPAAVASAQVVPPPSPEASDAAHQSTSSPGRAVERPKGLQLPFTQTGQRTESLQNDSCSSH